MRVLILDDEPHAITIAKLLVDWSSRGFDTILTSGSAEEALILIEENQPELILSDINLPGLSGLDLIERVRAQGLSSQIILISAYSDFSFAQRAIKAGCMDYLLKPISEESLNEAVDKAVRLIQEDQASQQNPKNVNAASSGMDAFANVSAPEETEFHSTADICRGIRSYLQNHYTEDITLDLLSQRFGISSSHLSRSYKKEMGIGLVDELTKIRLEAACQLLKNGKNTCEVAELIGFTDSKYFNRVFKKYFDCTPREYKTRIGNS